MLHKGLAHFSPSLVRDRQIVTTHLANALTCPGKQRDLEAATELGMQSLDMAESLDSARGDDRIRDLYFQMEPHAAMPAVRDFLERAEGLVGV